jgi:transposase-like protein
MVLVLVTCSYCHSDQVIKGGHTETGKQRYRCPQTTCAHRSFVLEPAYNGRLSQVNEQIIAMALNGGGIRDTARVLKISPTTVMNELKKSVVAEQCQPASIDSRRPSEQMARRDGGLNRQHH